MNRRNLLTAVLIGCVWTAGAVSKTQAAANCTPVSGTFLFTRFAFTGPTTAVGEGLVVGDLVGSFSAEYFNIQQQGDGVFLLNGEHTIVTAAGTLFTYDEIRLQFDSATGLARAASRLHFVGGGGRVCGSDQSGVHARGSEPLHPGGGIHFNGQICLP